MGLEKAILKNMDKGEQYEVQFNPKEYTVEKSVPWNPQATAGNDAPEMQFTTGQAKQLSFELFFDGYEEQRDVREPSGSSAGTKEIEKLALIDGDLHRPPKVLFVWGSFSFDGVIESMSQKYTMFLPDGKPCRATVSVRMKEARLVSMKEEENKSPDHAKMRVVRRGETLNSIAAEEYDDPAEWRRIADFNGIDDPREVVPGTKLMVPPIIR